MPAKSKAQQKFMGMVHAAQKGEKPASPEVAKAAKGMSKKAAKDFASTKHKGLPEKKKQKIKETLEKIDQLKELISEAKKKMKGEDPCWKGYEMVGTKKKGGKEVPNCVPKNEDIEESGLQYYTGKKKYGKDGMTALAKAGRKGASEEELGRIKDKYKKVKENKKDLTGDGKNDFDDVQAARRMASGQSKKAAVKAATSDKLKESNKDDLPFDGGEEVKGPHKDKYGNVIKTKNMAKHLAKKGRAAAEQEAKKKKETVKEGWDHDSLASRLFETFDEIHDHEASMAKAQLMRIAEQSIELFKMIQEGDNLEGWVAAKITKANDYINAVHQNLSYESTMEGGSGIDSGKSGQGFKTSGKQGIEPTGDLKHGMPMRLNTGSGRKPTAKLPGEMEEGTVAPLDPKLDKRVSDYLQYIEDVLNSREEFDIAHLFYDWNSKLGRSMSLGDVMNAIKDRTEPSIKDYLWNKIYKDMSKRFGKYTESIEEEFGEDVDSDLRMLANDGDEEELISALQGEMGSGVADALDNMINELQDELAAKGMNDVMNDQDKMIELLWDKVVDEYGSSHQELSKEDSYISELRKNLEKAINS
jgi:hypothetical protein